MAQKTLRHAHTLHKRQSSNSKSRDNQVPISQSEGKLPLTTAISTEIPSTPTYSGGNQCWSLAWDKPKEAEQQEASMAMLVGNSLQCMQGKGRVGQTGPRKDQTGMPNSFQPHACKQAQQEMPLLALPTAARHCYPHYPHGVSRLATKANAAQGSLPTGQCAAACGCSRPLGTPRCPTDVPSASSPARSGCCTAWLPAQWGSPARLHPWHDGSASMQIHQHCLGVPRLKKPPVIKSEWQISNLFQCYWDSLQS